MLCSEHAHTYVHPTPVAWEPMAASVCSLLHKLSRLMSITCRHSPLLPQTLPAKIVAHLPIQLLYVLLQASILQARQLGHAESRTHQAMRSNSMTTGSAC